MAFERYVDFIRRVSPTVLLGYWGERLNGTIAGLLWDYFSQGASEAVLSPLLTRVEQPPDALPPIADERNLAKYLAEDELAWQQRLLSAWDIWEQGGSATELINQLEAAGYAGCEVHSPIDWGRTPIPWESQFWIFMPAAAHGGAFAPGTVAGTGIAGAHLAGITGTFERAVELRYIAQNFRPADQVCRQIIVEVSGATCGADGVLCGGGNHLCGASHGYIGTGIPEV